MNGLTPIISIGGLQSSAFGAVARLCLRRVHLLTFSRLAQQWISEFHSARALPGALGSRLRSINYFASLVHSAELMNVEPKAVLGFLSFSIVLLKFHLRRWPIHNTFSLKRSRAICMLNAVFTFVSSVDAVRTSRQPNMEGNFWSRCELRWISPEKALPRSQMGSGIIAKRASRISHLWE